jgi:hypothetical protein
MTDDEERIRNSANVITNNAPHLLGGTEKNHKNVHSR